MAYRKSNACVCILVCGNISYFRAASVCIKSILEYTRFRIFVAYDGEVSLLPEDNRISYHKIKRSFNNESRPYNFLTKFEAAKKCIDICNPDIVLMIDADVVLCRNINEKDLIDGLMGYQIAMVEQKKIVRSKMNREMFLLHYLEYSLAVIAPQSQCPDINRFRFYNSGIVISQSGFLYELCNWAIQHINENVGKHNKDDHMIADQDYFQVWVNNIMPNTCNELKWYWNHCEYWDDLFPQFGVIFAHFSNFCMGPDLNSLAKMNKIFNSYFRKINQIVGRISLGLKE